VIVIKGSHVEFRMADGSRRRLPVSYGMIHDPDGKNFPRCSVFVGPVTRTQQPVKPSSKAVDYFGSKYIPRKAIIQGLVRSRNWVPVGEVAEIFYVRRGRHADRYYHPFKRFNPTLSKSGRFYRLDLRDGCIVDDRGFVFP
jgi:hypothetical protein